WPAVHSSGHRSGRDRSQNDRPGSAVLPHPFSDISRQRYRRKMQKTRPVLPSFSGARSGNSGHQSRRVRFRPVLRSQFRPLPVSFWKNSGRLEPKGWLSIWKFSGDAKSLWTPTRCRRVDTVEKGHCVLM
ncbi:unnamed protein product, partial [Prunus brigantina]